MTTSTLAGSGEKEKGIEVRARTVDEAVARGLVRLGGLSRSEVSIEIVQQGRAGVLGFGAEDAVVRLAPLGAGAKPAPETEPRSAPAADEPGRPAPELERPARPAPAPERAPERTAARSESPEAPPPAVERPAARAQPPERPRPAQPPIQSAAPTPMSMPGQAAEAPFAADLPAIGGAPTRVATPEVIATAQEVVLQLLGLMGFEGTTIDARSSLLPVTVEEENALVLVIRGPNTDRLLSHQASALYALQFVARLMLSRRLQGWTNLLLDVNDDRARRIQSIFQMAEQSANLVEREGKPVSLPPMTPYERRVVHLALRDHTSIATQSIGAGPNRKVTVRRKDQLLPNL